MRGRANREQVINACNAALASIQKDRKDSREGMIATQMRKRRWAWFSSSHFTREEAIKALTYPFSDYSTVGMQYRMWQNRLETLLEGALRAAGDEIELSAQDFEDIKSYYVRAEA